MSPMQRKSSLVQSEEPYGNLDMVTCRLSSCSPKVNNVHLPIMPESERQAVYRERKKACWVILHNFVVIFCFLFQI